MRGVNTKYKRTMILGKYAFYSCYIQFSSIHFDFDAYECVYLCIFISGVWHHDFSAIFAFCLSSFCLIMFSFFFRFSVSYCLPSTKHETIGWRRCCFSLVETFVSCDFGGSMWQHWISHIYWKTIIIKSKLRNQLSRALRVPIEIDIDWIWDL